MRGNLRMSLRALRRHPLWTICSVLCVAVGVASTTLLAAIWYATAWRPVPITEPRGLARLSVRDGCMTCEDMIDPSVARDLQAAWPSNEASPAMYREEKAVVAANGVAVQVSAVRADPGFFHRMQVIGLRGRLPFGVDDARDHAAVLSYALWRQLGAPQPLGRVSLHVNDVPTPVVGVFPPGASLPAATAIWIASDPTRDDTGARSNVFLLIRGPRPWDLLDLQIRLNALTATIRAQRPGLSAEWAVMSTPIWKELRSDASGEGIVLCIALLLSGVACLNLGILRSANLLRRQPEFATQLALGASANQVTWPVLLEAVPIALMSLPLAAGLLLVSYRAAEACAAAGMVALPELAIAPWWFECAAALVMAAASFIALCSVQGTRHIDAASVLREAAGRSSSSRAAVAWRGRLITIEVAATTLCAVVAVLCAVGYRQITADPGDFSLGDVTVAPLFAARDTRARHELDPAGLIRAQHLVGAGAIAAWTDPTGRLAQSATGDARDIDIQSVVGDFFGVLGASLVDGAVPSSARQSTGADVVVNRVLADLFWPGQSAIGQVLTIHTLKPPQGPGGPDSIFVVVGVVDLSGVVAESRLENRLEPGQRAKNPTAFRFMTGTLRRALTLGLRGPAVTRKAEQVFDREARTAVPDYTIFPMSSLRARWARTFAPLRTRVFAASAAAAAVLLMALLGITSIVLEAAAARRKEWGIRLALGGSVRHVVWQAAVPVLWHVGIGLALGVGATIWATQSLTGMLFGGRNGLRMLAGTSLTSPLVLGGVVLGLAVISAASAALPALKAARTNPVEFLR